MQKPFYLRDGLLRQMFPKSGHCQNWVALIVHIHVSCCQISWFVTASLPVCIVAYKDFFQRLLFSLISWILSRSIGRWVHPTDPLKTFAISFPNNLCKCNFHFPKYKYEHWNFSKNKDWEGKEISSIKSTWNKNHPSPFSWIYDQSTAGMLMNKKYWNLAGKKICYQVQIWQCQSSKRERLRWNWSWR